jgi:hypothetical protein
MFFLAERLDHFPDVLAGGRERCEQRTSAAATAAAAA